MLMIDQEYQFKPIVDHLRWVVDPDVPEVVPLRVINDYFTTFLDHIERRHAIDQIEAELQTVYKPFYDAFINLLLRLEVSELHVSGVMVLDTYGLVGLFVDELKRS